MADSDRKSSYAWVWDLEEDSPGHPADYAKLAHFVSVSALEGLNFRVQDSYDLVKLEIGTREYADKAEAVLRQLYARLQSRRYNYDHEPWHVEPLHQQRLRDPRLIDRTSGTCIDLALMFSAMCKANGLRPYLVVSHTLRGWHAMVIVSLDCDVRTSKSATSPVDAGATVVEPRDHGGLFWHYARVGSDRMRTVGNAVAVDVTCACRNTNQDFGEAVATADGILGEAAHSVNVIDVVEVQLATGDFGASPPEERDRPAIYRRLPTRGEFFPFPSRQTLEEVLRARRGTVALYGDSGRGKSMMAHHIAQTADEGSGWFLDASTPNTLLTDLAQAEARELGQNLVDLEKADLRVYAKQAIRRLRDSELPWVVVLDNANGNPLHLAEFRPRPRPERGQSVIVTTTNHEWADVADELVTLDPLGGSDVEEEIRGIDSLGLSAVAGRPLLVDASRRLLETARALGAVDAGLWWLRPGLAGAVDPEQAAPAEFWAAVKEIVDGDAVPLAVAQAAAWFPPTQIDRRALAAAVGATAWEVNQAVKRLGELGVVDLGGPTVIMHRLFRNAVQADAMAAGPLEQVRLIRRMLTAGDSLRLLQQVADIESSELMQQTVTAYGTREDRIVVTHELALLLERYDVERAARWYKEMLTELDWQLGSEVADEHRRRVINALRGRARPIFRDKDYARFAEALSWTEAAEQVGRGSEEHDILMAVAEASALKGLLMRSSAGRLKGEQALAALKQAETILTESFETRAALLGTHDPAEHPDLDRGKYNLAGLEVRLAQVDQQIAASNHLQRAYEVYDEILKVRENRYRTREIEEVACCINGLALADYYKCVLVSEDPEEQTRLLRGARGNVEEAARIRGAVAGRKDTDDAAKSLTLLAKIVLLELRVAGADKQGDWRDATAIAEFLGELTDFLSPSTEVEPGGTAE